MGERMTGRSTVLMRSALLASLLAAWALLGCGGEGSACRSSEDCSGTRECDGPSDWSGCGIPGTERCAADSDCDGLLCHAISDPCSPDGIGSECRTACVDGGCGEGFRCAANGACETIPCDEGYACPSYQACDPSLASSGPVHARAHGCVAISCSDDDACPSEGACVNGVCQEGPGSCVEPMAIP